MVILLQKTADDEDIKKALEDHLDYIKITVDIEKEIVAIGGMYHADAEKELLNLRSKQKNIWGGGFDTITKTFETNALVNIRPLKNQSSEILNEKIRNKFLAIAKKYLKNYVK